MKKRTLNQYCIECGKYLNVNLKELLEHKVKSPCDNCLYKIKNGN